uniref:Uncharacterized protein n=1 Tax=Oryza barthii TaxID=65489 RepID=A0A0D3GXD0_9ORYZ
MAPCRQDQPKTIPSLRRGMVRPHNAAPPRPGPPSLLYVRVIHQLILGILLILTVTVDSGSSAATLTSSRSSSSSLCVIWGSIISRSPAGLVTAGLREAGLESSNQILGVLTLSKAMNGQWKILLKLDEVPTLEQTTKAIQEAIDALRPS